MTRDEAMSLFNITESMLTEEYTTAKRVAKRKVALMHPDNENGDNEKFIVYREAYSILFKGGADPLEHQSVPEGRHKGFRFSEPKQRKTITLDQLSRYMYRTDIEIVIELPIEFNNSSTTLYIRYKAGQHLYAKSLVLPKGAKTMYINEKQYTLGKATKYIIDLQEFKLELDILCCGGL